MPMNPEAYLISSILRDQDMVSALSRGIAAGMFHAYTDEWDWIERYYTRYKRVPSKTAFKAQFPEFRIKNVNDTAHYADEVSKSHAHYTLTGAMRDVVDHLSDGDVDAAVHAMQTSIVRIAAEMQVGNHDSDIIEDWKGIYSEVKRRKIRADATGMSGLPTGFPTLDERTGGPQPGQFWVIGARLGEGKSWTMLRMAVAAVMAGHRIQFDALEQSRAEVGSRVHTLLSSQIGQDMFSNLDLMQGKNFSITSYRRFLGQLKTNIGKGALNVADGSRGRVSALTIASQIERNKPDGVYIDYITLMGMGGEGDWRSIGQLTKDLKGLSNEYEIPIIGASQLNRTSGLGKEPAGPEALSQSDAIGQDADVVITGRQISPSVLVMKMAKNRHGPGGFKWYCDFRPTLGIFKECSYDEAMDLRDKDMDKEKT